MMKAKLLRAGVIILVIVHGMNFFAAPQALFQTVWWLDIPFHFFGGLGVGFCALWFAYHTGFVPSGESGTWLASRMRMAFPEGAPWWWSFSFAGLLTWLVMLGWEQFEIYLLHFLSYPLPVNYFTDTSGDYLVGSLGAIVAWLGCRYQKSRFQDRVVPGLKTVLFSPGGRS